MLILCEEKGGDRMNLFFVFLGTAAWQDLRTRSISLEVLAGGAVGVKHFVSLLETLCFKA